MEQQEVDDKFVAVDLEPELPAHESHPVTERGEGLLQLVHQRLFQAPLTDRPGQAEVVEHVEVAGQRLREIGVRRQGRGEVRRGGTDPSVQGRGDLVVQDVCRTSPAGPPARRTRCVAAGRRAW